MNGDCQKYVENFKKALGDRYDKERLGCIVARICTWCYLMFNRLHSYIQHDGQIVCHYYGCGANDFVVIVYID